MSLIQIANNLLRICAKSKHQKSKKHAICFHDSFLWHRHFWANIKNSQLGWIQLRDERGLEVLLLRMPLQRSEFQLKIGSETLLNFSVIPILLLRKLRLQNIRWAPNSVRRNLRPNESVEREVYVDVHPAFVSRSAADSRIVAESWRASQSRAMRKCVALTWAKLKCFLQKATYH